MTATSAGCSCPCSSGRGTRSSGSTPSCSRDARSDREPADLPALRMDLRDSTRTLKGFDAVVHLAALSNDPLGALDPAITYDINHEAGGPARRGRQGGRRDALPRSASSCSLYGASAGDAMLTERAAFHPITALRRVQGPGRAGSGPARGRRLQPDLPAQRHRLRPSRPRLRADIVVNNLVGLCVHDGRSAHQSDGSPWRPLVHVETSRAHSSPCSRRRAKWSTTRRSTSAATRRTTGPGGRGDGGRRGPRQPRHVRRGRRPTRGRYQGRLRQARRGAARCSVRMDGASEASEQLDERTVSMSSRPTTSSGRSLPGIKRIQERLDAGGRSTQVAGDRRRRERSRREGRPVLRRPGDAAPRVLRDRPQADGDDRLPSRSSGTS